MEEEKKTNQVSTQQFQPQQSTVSPTIDVYGTQVNRSDFINYINENANSFFSTYDNMWSNKQKQQLLQQKDALINNIANGNITKIENNSIDITNLDNSGIDSTQGGAGQIIVGMADKVAKEVHTQLEAAKPHKTWDNNTLEQSWLNYFYGGKDPGDYSSWVNRDAKNDKGKRATTNRVAAIREWLDTIKPEEYTSGLDAFGGQEGFTNRLNALKTALADGTIDNSDYTTADRLGFGTQLRTLLNDNIISQEDTDANANGETSSYGTTKPTTDEEIIANAWNGGNPQDIYKQVANTIRNWKAKEYSTRIARASYNSATNYLNYRNKNDRSGSYNIHDPNSQQAYYSTKFFPEFFQKFKDERFSPEYINNHNNPIGTWKGQQGVWQYIADNLTLAIRNRMYGNGTLLGQYADQLNPVLGLDGKPTGFWTIPESFNETNGTELVYNPDTGEYKRISLADPKYRYLMQSYLLGKGINLQQSQDQSQAYKEGGKIDKLQYGGEFVQGAFNNPQVTSIAQLGVQGAPTAQQLAQQRKLQQQQAQEKAAAAEQQKRIDAGNRKIQGLGDLNGSDIARLAALGQDIAALGAATFAPGYGTAASGVLGLTSMLTDLGADIADDQLTKGDVIKNAAVNTGLAALGMIPGGKSASIVSKLAKNAPKLLAVWGVSNAFKPAKESLQKVINGGDMTEQDLKNILWGIKSVVSTGTIGRNTYKDWKYSGIRESKVNATKPVTKYEVAVNKGNQQQKVTLTQEQYSLLNKAKTQTEANAKLKQYLANNGEKDSDQFSFKEGLFPEKASKNLFNRNKDILQGNKITQQQEVSGRSVFERANDLRKLRNPKLSKYLNTDYDVYVNGKSPIKNPFPSIHINKFEKFQDRFVESGSKQQNKVGTGTSSIGPQNNGTTGSSPTSGTNPTPPTSKPNTISQSVLDKIQGIFDADNKTINIENLKNFQSKYSNLINDRLSRADKHKLDMLIQGKYKSSSGKDILSNEEVFTILAKALTKEASKTHKSSNKALQATKDALASIKYKQGGILYAQNGTTTYNAQVFGKYGKNRKYGGISNTNNNTTWYSNIFNPYQQYILDQLSTYGKDDTYGNWINGMQDSHEKLYQAAGGVNGNFLNEAYNNNADAVRNYQQAYDADQYSKNSIAHGYNTRGIAQAYNSGRYSNIGYAKRNGQDSLNTQWTPDGSYSGQTDDRRILGREGDFTDQQLIDWNNKLKAIGWEQYLDPTTKYYKLRRLQQFSKVDGADPTTMQKSHVLTDILSGLKDHITDFSEAARVGWNNRFNSKQRDYQLQHMNPVLLQPYAFYRKIYGDYGTMSEYNRQGANTQNVANSIASNTADGSLAAATQLQGASQANDLAIKGRLADNQMIRDTYEKALAQNKENLQIANNVANTNRQNLNNNERERAQVVLATNTMNHQNWDKFWQARDLKLQQKQDERDAMQKYLDYATVMNNNSRYYDPRVRDITNKYRQMYLDAGDDTAKQQVIASQMQDELNSLGYEKQDALLDSLAKLRGLKYSYIPTWRAKVTIPATATPTYKAKGGTLDVTRLATTAVKEKNKDIERMYKDWSKKDDRFFNQLGKLRQARFDKIIKIK